MARSTILVALAVVCFTAAASAQEYELVDLGFFQPQAINNAEQLVGSNWNEFHPLIWQNGATVDLIQPGWSEGSAMGINNDGVVVGQSVNWSDPAQHYTRPYMWSAGAVTYLDNGVDLGSAYAISDTGIVGGVIQQQLANGHYSNPLPFIWSNGSLTLLPTYGGEFTWLTTVNSSGVAAGRAQVGTSTWEAVYWKGGSIYALPRLGPSASVNAMNDAGLMVGQTTTNMTPQLLRAVAWRDETLIDLGTLGGSTSYANAVNESGDIVGSSQTATGLSAAFLYSDGQMINLDTTVGAPNGCSLVRAQAINDNGVIIAYGRRPGDTYANRSFLLRPQPATPAKQLERLIASIAGLGLERGFAQSLTAGLQQALAGLASGNSHSCNQIEAFENEVRAQSGKKLGSADAERLLAAAERIRTAIGC